jgi:hypothetical protein
MNNMKERTLNHQKMSHLYYPLDKCMLLHPKSPTAYMLPDMTSGPKPIGRPVIGRRSPPRLNKAKPPAKPRLTRTQTIDLRPEYLKTSMDKHLSDMAEMEIHDTTHTNAL